jgi:CBS domain-containing protein
MIDMNPTQRRYFRDAFRDARAAALRDSEDFAGIVYAIERLGSFLLQAVEDLSRYRGDIIRVAEHSPLHRLPKTLHGWNPPFNRLFKHLIEARNDALHQGAFARHLTTHAIQVSLILEDALMDGIDKVCDYMITNVITASRWQPLSFVRQQMLVNSFSFLPILDQTGEPTNELISDCSLASYLRNSRKERLAQQLGEAVEKHGLTLLDTATCRPTDKLNDVLNEEKVKNQRLPILVVNEEEGQKRLLGIVTAFDLL